MSNITINWWDASIGFDCICGNKDFIISEEPVTCEDCGRVYRFLQRMSHQEPVGRCQGPDCNNWLYGTQPKKIYCSEKCGIRARVLKRQGDK